MRESPELRFCNRNIFPGHLGSAVGKAPALSSGPDPRVLRPSPVSGALLSGEAASPSDVTPTLVLSFSFCQVNKILRKQKSKK